MFTLFGLRYRTHFCAECGNARARQHIWQHRYLCQDCARRHGYYRRLILLVSIIGLSIFLLFGRVRRDPSPPPFQAPAQAPVVSAFDAVGDRNALRSEDEPLRVLCGARTRRGTPCRRMVLPGQRCAQHQGRPSILGAEQLR